MRWTEEKTDMLVLLWKQGLSASQIALRIGDVKRSAVLGKLYRMGMLGRARDRGAVQTLPLKPSMTVQRRRRGQHMENCSVPRLRELHAAMKVAPEVRSERVVPTTSGVLFEQLEAHHCRFAFGDHPPFSFCGAQREEGSSYCSHHKAICCNGIPKVRLYNEERRDVAA